MTTLLLAVGNPLRGDDGIGAAVLNALPALPSDVVRLDGGTAGLNLVLTLRGYTRAVIIDAADLGAPPGSWQLLSAEQICAPAANLHGWHAAGLAEALTLGRTLGILPPELVIFGIQPGQLDWSPGLTPAVAAAIPEVCAAILVLLLSTLQ